MRANLGPVLTFAEPVLHAERCHANSVGVVDGGTRLTFAQFAQRSRRVAGLVSQLTRPGDRVAILAAPSHRTLELYCAVPSVGRILTPLNTRLTRRELSVLLRDAEPRLLLSDRTAEDLGELADYVDNVVTLDGDYEQLVAATAEVPLGVADGRPLNEDEVALLLYTGGTTGTSKGVMLSHRNKITDGLGLQAGLHLTPEDAWQMMSPLFHAAGTFNVHACLWSGARMVVLAGFDPATALDTVERERTTITFGVPTMLASLVDELHRRPRDVSSLRVLGYGAAPATSALIRRVHHGLPHVELVTMYGATEMGPMGTLGHHIERHIDGPRARSAGQPVVDLSVRVVDTSDREVMAGEVGEVVVRGPSVMAGYWRKPVDTAGALRGGWYRSGDVGYFDGDGWLYLVDRVKDMIVTGGENVYSTEVEEVLGAHPAVLECAVFGVPDQHWGEAVHAVAVVAPGGDVSADELREHCRTSLAGYKVPRTIEVRTDPLPVSGAGKILKRELRAPHWHGRDRRI